MRRALATRAIAGGGQDSREEVPHPPGGAAPGANLGRPLREGTRRSRDDAEFVTDPREIRRVAEETGRRYMGEERAAEFGDRNGGPGQVVIAFRPPAVTAMADLTGPSPPLAPDVAAPRSERPPRDAG